MSRITALASCLRSTPMSKVDSRVRLLKGFGGASRKPMNGALGTHSTSLLLTCGGRLKTFSSQSSLKPCKREGSPFNLWQGGFSTVVRVSHRCVVAIGRLVGFARAARARDLLLAAPRRAATWGVSPGDSVLLPDFAAAWRRAAAGGATCGVAWTHRRCSFRVKRRRAKRDATRNSRCSGCCGC